MIIKRCLKALASITCFFFTATTLLNGSPAVIDLHGATGKGPARSSSSEVHPFFNTRLPKNLAVPSLAQSTVLSLGDLPHIRRHMKEEIRNVLDRLQVTQTESLSAIKNIISEEDQIGRAHV